MKRYILVLFLAYSVSSTSQGHATTKVVHVFVALCDNANQGIVPVPSKIGNGQDQANNLYWGCGYGVKSFFKLKTTEWIYQGTIPSKNPRILETVLFKHKTRDCYLYAEAYDGAHIKSCIEDFLLAANQQGSKQVNTSTGIIDVQGEADLVVYVGHDGLMEFDVDLNYQEISRKPTQSIILACYSQAYFSSELRNAQAEPLLWTTHLMAPEAYTLRSALTGWLQGESPEQIEERAAQAYHQYQKCGINGARNLFTFGFGE